VLFSELLLFYKCDNYLVLVSVEQRG
jgi:hypothetical protein